jgi:hypothetical protein
LNLYAYFDRVVLINLRRRPDRLARVQVELHRCHWPFLPPCLFTAIDGQTGHVPADWQSGPGAWGCSQSHQAVLAKALADGVKNLLVLEDDVSFVDGFVDKTAAFLAAVPADWDQLVFGGTVDRGGGIFGTHCYAIRPPFMGRLLARWQASHQHCDWVAACDPAMQLAHKVFYPDPFLAAQLKGSSDVATAKHQPKLGALGMQARLVYNAP